FDAGMAVWPHGRLVALEAPETGSFTTLAVLAPGRKLFINALTRRAGQITIEAADLEGKTLADHAFDDCAAIIGDQPHAPVKWKHAEDLGVEPNQPIVLRFRMSKAKIYSLDFE